MSLSLRSYWRSSCSWRVRIALNWKGLPYDTIPVHLVADGGQQHGASHQRVNPMREVPVLIVDDQPLAQSLAILEYLEESQPTPPLLPKSPVDRARVRQMAEVINSGIQPIQNLRVMQKLGRDFELPKAAQASWSKDWISFGFDALHQLVEIYGGCYAFGEDVSFADLCLIPQLYNARRFKVDLERYPRFLDIEKACEQHPAFAAAHPSQQPDAV